MKEVLLSDFTEIENGVAHRVNDLVRKNIFPSTIMIVDIPVKYIVVNIESQKALLMSRSAFRNFLFFLRMLLFSRSYNYQSKKEYSQHAKKNNPWYEECFCYQKFLFCIHIYICIIQIGSLFQDRIACD